jgi:hypothetical protein
MALFVGAVVVVVVVVVAMGPWYPLALLRLLRNQVSHKIGDIDGSALAKCRLWVRWSVQDEWVLGIKGRSTSRGSIGCGWVDRVTERVEEEEDERQDKQCP